MSKRVRCWHDCNGAAKFRLVQVEGAATRDSCVRHVSLDLLNMLVLFKLDVTVQEIA
jgi:hypothetical protein